MRRCITFGDVKCTKVPYHFSQFSLMLVDRQLPRPTSNFNGRFVWPDTCRLCPFCAAVVCVPQAFCFEISKESNFSGVEICRHPRDVFVVFLRKHCSFRSFFLLAQLKTQMWNLVSYQLKNWLSKIIWSVYDVMCVCVLGWFCRILLSLDLSQGAIT